MINYPILTICVCSRNSASRIKDTLLSLLLQTADLDKYEILVIDNASEDTNELKNIVINLNQYKNHIRLIEEPNIGLSYARNRAVKESRTDYIFFIDDDAIANNQLVECYINSILEHHPDILGGNVLPLFNSMPPEELSYQWWPQWSLKHFGETDRWLKTGEYFIGTNIGVFRNILISHPFDCKMGRVGDSLTGGEEWFLGDSRFKRRFVAGAYVFHKVPQERMNSHYFVKRTYDLLKQQGNPLSFKHFLFSCFRVLCKNFYTFLKIFIFYLNIRWQVWKLSNMN